MWIKCITRRVQEFQNKTCIYTFNGRVYIEWKEWKLFFGVSAGVVLIFVTCRERFIYTRKESTSERFNERIRCESRYKRIMLIAGAAPTQFWKIHLNFRWFTIICALLLIKHKFTSLRWWCFVANIAMHTYKLYEWRWAVLAYVD